MMFRVLIIFLPVVVMLGCGKQVCVETPDTSGIVVDLNIERLDLQLSGVETKQDLQRIIDDNPIVAEVYFQSAKYSSETVLIDSLYSMLQNESLKSLFREVEEYYKDISDIENTFREAFKIVSYFYPDFRSPKIQTIVTGFINDNYISDSLIIIGLEYYLGDEGTYAPPYPDYMLKRYQRDYLAPQFMLMYSTFFINTDLSDQTALAEMVFYGKAYYFAKQVIPCAPDSLFTGYTAEEMKDIESHEQVIWASFLENELLYETGHMMKNKFFAERPKTLEVGEKCPGRIGRWIGWRIVDQFMEERSDVTLPELMGMTDAKKIFNESGYKPIPY